jgi:hypothetical protein
MKNLKMILVACIALSLASCVSSQKYTSSKQTWEERYTRLNADYDDLQTWKTTWEVRYNDLDAKNSKLRVENLRLETALKAANVTVAPLSLSGKKITVDAAPAVAAVQMQEAAPLTVAVQK